MTVPRVHRGPAPRGGAATGPWGCPPRRDHGRAHSESALADQRTSTASANLVTVDPLPQGPTLTRPRISLQSRACVPAWIRRSERQRQQGDEEPTPTVIQATVRHPRVSSSRDHVRGAADRPTYDHAPTVGASCSSRPIPDAPAELGRPPGWLHRLARELDRRGRRVAELLHQVLGYLLDGGIRCRWLVVEGDQDFFWVTAHPQPRTDRKGRRAARRRRSRRLSRGPPSRARSDPRARPSRRRRDTPRSADGGPIVPLVEAGLRVVWVCHVGVDAPTDVVRSAWEFLRQDVEVAHASVFSRRAYVWIVSNDGRSP